MSPLAWLNPGCRAGVNQEVEYFFMLGLRPKPRSAGPPPTATAQPVVGLVMVGLEMQSRYRRPLEAAERGSSQFPLFRIILRLENAAGRRGQPVTKRSGSVFAGRRATRKDQKQ